jgi:hypothetical protein
VAEDWEAQFKKWAKPPGKTEKDRCGNAVSAISNAIKASDKLRVRSISVFVQGSYRNNTNVRKDSDVDIGILCRNTFFFELPNGTTPETFDFMPVTYHYDEFKNDIEAALIGYFGHTAVSRGNKAFDIHETTYHVEADVAAFFEHRRYNADGTYLEGVELLTDSGGKPIINWPEQHYQNGVTKNNATGRRFKAIVRVLKTLSNEMAESGIQAGNIPGFLIECLVWNVPNDHFQHYTYTDDVKAALVFLYEHTQTDGPCREWGEVSELKYLFCPSQKWTREQANTFTVCALNYIGWG